MREWLKKKHVRFFSTDGAAAHSLPTAGFAPHPSSCTAFGRGRVSRVPEEEHGEHLVASWPGPGIAREISFVKLKESAAFQGGNRPYSDFCQFSACVCVPLRVSADMLLFPLAGRIPSAFACPWQPSPCCPLGSGCQSSSVEVTALGYDLEQALGSSADTC